MYQNNMNTRHGIHEEGYPHFPDTGPLMTNHLQVRNLDRELAILRRKREVVQREQQLLSMENEINRKRQYEQINRNSNMPNTYGNVWQPPTKRSNTPQQTNPWMTTLHDNHEQNMSKSMSTNYIPSLLSKKIDPPVLPMALKPIVHPILKNSVAQRLLRPINVRKDFRLTAPHLTKKKAKIPPNKLNSYPVKERKNLVSKAMGSQLVKNNKANKPSEDPEAMILREDQIPNKQLNGRLELALGSIVKEIRSSNCHDNTFKTLISNPKHQRTMKQAVRERIRTVMLNKTVGSVVDIVNIYREKFPKGSDKDIVDLVINSEHPNVVTVIESENPEEFFKKNITAILEKKLEEMASNLLKMYTNTSCKTALAYKKDADESNRTLDESVEKESELDKDLAMKVLRGLTGKYVTIEERNSLSKYYTELIEKLLEEKLPEFLPRCTEYFTKIFDMDKQLNDIKSMSAKRLKEEIKEKKAESNMHNETEVEICASELPQNETSNNNKTEENSNDVEIVEDADIEMKDKVATENKNTQEITLTENMHLNQATDESNKSEEITQDSNTRAELKGEKSIPALKPTTPISNKTHESSATLKSITPKPTEAESPTTPKSSVALSTPSAKEQPYYVKLIGRPKLPNRAAICDFLNIYQPSSIKKHKSINNLLVVGFVNQEDYYKILAANETVIGDTTIIIKGNEKVNPGKEGESLKNVVKIEIEQDMNESNNSQNETEHKDTTEEDIKGGNEVSKKITTSEGVEIDDPKDLIGKELDDQISDFLSTLKEVNEEINTNTTVILETVKEAEDEIKNGEKPESDKTDKSSKVKEIVRATPARSSSRLGNLTPSTIRTRRASRLMQEQ